VFFLRDIEGDWIHAFYRLQALRACPRSEPAVEKMQSESFHFFSREGGKRIVVHRVKGIANGDAVKYPCKIFTHKENASGTRDDFSKFCKSKWCVKHYFNNT
jgi:hypothetical protein